MQPFAQNGLFLFNFCFTKKIHGNCIFLAKGCIVAPNSRKQTPLKIRFYFQTNINQPINTFFKSWQWHQFNIGLTITLFCFVTCNFLPNFIIALTHSIFNIKSSVIPLDEMSHCVEKDAHAYLDLVPPNASHKQLKNFNQ